MATVPVVPDFVAGEKVTSAKMRQIRDVLNWTMTSSPLFDAVQTVSQTLTDSTWAPITFSAEVIDRDSGHSTTANTSRYTAKTPGWYLVSGIAAAAITAGNIFAVIAKNGARQPGATNAPGSSPVGAAACVAEAYVYLNGTTDYVELHAAVVGGGATVSTPILADYCSRFHAEWKSN